ncbi:MAG: hypothetical protein LBB42_05515 [Coriobacteriales bacterium]|nr:hypothetical protein [Coriobacteriales bacterium]
MSVEPSVRLGWYLCQVDVFFRVLWRFTGLGHSKVLRITELPLSLVGKY